MFLSKVNRDVLRFLSRNLCSSGRILPEKLPKSSPKCRTRWDRIQPVEHFLRDGTVLISNSVNIYDNLAIEDWLYQNYDFSQKNERLLLLWRNEPAVVVGRHQNLWREINVQYCQREGIHIARRNSGGGTVYHDLENLNICFLTSRKEYDRKRNLAFIRDCLHAGFGLETEINTREDLIVSGSGEKVSGTASKLNAYNSYHHCTLLIDADRNKLRNSLRKVEIPDFETRATKSVSSPVLNLKTLNAAISLNSVIEQLGENFSNFCNSPNSQTHHLEPCLLPEIDSTRQNYSHWDWVYGKSPAFTVSNSLLIEGDAHRLELTVDKGRIKKIEFSNQFNRDDDRIYIQSTMLDTRFEEFELFSTIARLKSGWPQGEAGAWRDEVCLALMNCYNKCNQ